MCGDGKENGSKHENNNKNSLKMGTSSKTGFFLCVYKAFSPFPAKQSPFIHSSCSISWKELKSPLQEELELCQAKFCHFQVCQTLPPLGEPGSLSWAWNGSEMGFPCQNCWGSTRRCLRKTALEGEEPLEYSVLYQSPGQLPLLPFPRGF